MHRDFAFTLTVYGSIINILIKFFTSMNLAIIAKSAIFDTAIFFLIYGIYRYGWKFSFYILFSLNFIICALFSTYLDDAYIRHDSLLRVNISSIEYFMTDIVTFYQIGAFLLVAGSLIYVSKKIRIKKCSKELYKIIMVISVIAPAALVIGDSRFSHPYVNTFEDIVLVANSETIAPLETENQMLFMRKSHSSSFSYDNIYVFVMESVMFHQYDCHIDGLKFTDYYSTNQDSATAIISMLSSTFVPYEPYTDTSWVLLSGSRFSDKENIVKSMRDQGYRAHFLASMEEMPQGPSFYEWDEIHNIKYPQEGYICDHEFEFQHDCEDRSIYDKLIEISQEDGKKFVFQEFIYGHTQSYNQKLGLNNCDYYCSYVKDFIQSLKKNDRWENTLIILLSDHGEKSIEYYTHPDGYKIPLIFIAANIQPEIVSTQYSHLDFADILKSVAGNNSLPEKSIVPFVGPTFSGTVGFYDDDSFIYLRQGSKYDVMRKSRNFNTTDAAEFLGALEFYRDSYKNKIYIEVENVSE